MVSTQAAHVGQTVRLRLPYSEVCMYMLLAGQVRDVLVLRHGAQILNPDRSPFSAPITHGEAGLLHRDQPDAPSEESRTLFWYTPAD